MHQEIASPAALPETCRRLAVAGDDGVVPTPLHPDRGRVRVVDVQDVPFDPRLFRRVPVDAGRARP